VNIGFQEHNTKQPPAVIAAVYVTVTVSNLVLTLGAAWIVFSVLGSSEKPIIILSVGGCHDCHS